MKKYIIIIFYSLLFVNPVFSADAPANTAETGYSGSELGQPSAQGISITPQGVVKETKLQAEPVLKRIDINRIGSAPNYETFEG